MLNKNRPVGIPVDQETEIGVNRDFKSHGGIADISTNHAVTHTLEILSYAFNEDMCVMQCRKVPDLVYNIEEADQRLILHAHYASSQDPHPDVVIIRSRDTDSMVWHPPCVDWGGLQANVYFSLELHPAHATSTPLSLV